MSNPKTAVVTGGAGVIGSHLVERLLSENYTVVVIDDCSSGNPDNLPVSKGLHLYDKDIADPTLLDIYLEHQPELIFHLAARYANELSVREPERDLEVNAGGTLAQLNFALKARVKRFVYASSSCVYAPSEHPLKEDDPLLPETPYAISKLAGEYYCRFFADYHHLSVVILRYFNSYGPKESTGSMRGVIPRFIGSALENKSLEITGDGTETRDFTYIEDTVSGTLAAARAPLPGCSIFNIGAGQPVTLNTLAETIHQLTGTRIPVIYSQRRPWDKIPYRAADITKAQQLLDFNPQFSLSEGLRRTWDWYQKKAANRIALCQYTQKGS